MTTGPSFDIETERLLLRGPIESDAEDWAATIWTDAEVMEYMPGIDGEPVEFANGIIGWFDEVRAERQIGAWIITDKATGEFMGHAILAFREKFGEPELGYALGRAFWGKGYAGEAAKAIVDYGFAQPGVNRIFAVVVPENEPSWRILKRLGFEYEKDVTHYDMPLAYYALSSA